MSDKRRPGTPVDPLELRIEARNQRKSMTRLFTLISRCTRLVWRSGRWLFSFLVGFQFATAALSAAQVLLVASVLAAILEIDPDSAVRAPGLILPVVGLAATMAGISLLGAVQGSIRRYLGESVARRMWQQVLSVSTRVGLRTFEDPTFYDRLQRVQASAVSRPFQVTQALVGIIGSLATTVAVGATLVAIHPALLALLLIGGVPLLLTSRRESRLEFDFTVEQTPRQRERSYLSMLLTGRREAKEVRAFDLGPGLRDRFDSLYGAYQHDLSRHLKRRTRLSLLGNLASAVTLAATLFVLVLLIMDGQVTVAEAGAAIVAIRMLQGQVQGLLGNIQSVFEAGLFLDDVERFMRLGDAPEGDAEAAEAPQDFETITTRDLHFTYPGTDAEALSGIDFTLHRGEVVALVGENGSGKTTLAKILAGLYDPTEGDVLWDGQSSAAIRRSSWRSRVAVIFQDFVAYAFSASENISVGNFAAPTDLGAVRAAARRVGADGFLSRLPDGYSTMLSRMFANGHDLSGGQWQRVAIARALYRDAPLVILDEPTAALDPRAEHALFESLRTVLHGRSAVFVSHRFSSVRAADRIYVLDDGRVVEHGTHEELMDLDGTYAELFTLQAAAYLDDAVASDGHPTS